MFSCLILQRRRPRLLCCKTLLWQDIAWAICAQTQCAACIRHAAVYQYSSSVFLFGAGSRAGRCIWAASTLVSASFHYHAIACLLSRIGSYTGLVHLSLGTRGSLAGAMQGSHSQASLPSTREWSSPPAPLPARHSYPAPSPPLSTAHCRSKSLFLHRVRLAPSDCPSRPFVMPPRGAAGRGSGGVCVRHCGNQVQVGPPGHSSQLHPGCAGLGPGPASCMSGGSLVAARSTRCFYISACPTSNASMNIHGATLWANHCVARDRGQDGPQFWSLACAWNSFVVSAGGSTRRPTCPSTATYPIFRILVCGLSPHGYTDYT